MAAIDLKSLVGKLDEHCRRSLEAAAGLTLSRSHYNVEIEHWLLKLIDGNGTDIPLILRHYDADEGRFRTDLNAGLDKMRTGNARAPGLSPDIIDLVKQAWLLASVEQGLTKLRSGHLIWALLADETLARRTREISGQLLRLQPDALKRDFDAILGNSSEAATVITAGEPGAAPTDGSAPRRAGTAALDQFTIDLTARARAGRIDPILGRDLEIRQVIDILTRRRQNNPILTGEAGVGKTAVVEGFALRIAAGDVPPALKDVTLRTLDLGLLQAGAGVKGEFENRLKSVIEETQASPKPVILFIDEAHTLIGAGGSAGQGDAANLLKPALARGELRTIAATTWAEYKKYFEKDAALTRRFQTVKVEEPTEALAVAMIRGLVSTLEAHHKIRILDEAVIEAVRLSARFIPSRQLPDKAVSLLDTACARAAMSQAGIPAPIEDLQRQLALIDTETGILRREQASGADHTPRVAELNEARLAANDQLGVLEARWQQERALVAEAAEVRTALEAPEPADGPSDRSQLRALLSGVMERLRALQGERPLIFPVVDAQAVAEIVENWTGIPAGRMRSDEIRTVMNLKQAMEKRIVGQPHALDAVAQAIRTSRAKLTDPRKPIGVFLMVGTSGTGKTETALALADLLYGGEQNLTVINMTEFKEEHKVSLLMGSPPGYVGYGEGGILTEAVRRRPYSVLLLDEMEKAHPGVQDVFFQVFDKGNMKDGEGRDIDFKNTVIIMTSNAGTDLIAKLFADPETAPDAAGLAEALRPELMKYFRPAFLGRVTLVPYFPLSDAIIRQIVDLQLERIRRRVWDSYRAAFAYDDSVAETIAARCKESSSGARNIENILSRTLLPELSAEVLSRLANGLTISRVTVVTDSKGSFGYTVS